MLLDEKGYALRNIIAPDNLDLDRYARLNPEAFRHAGYRRMMTKRDPFLFAWLYLPHHLDPKRTGTASLADFHIDMAASAAEYWTITDPGEREVRNSWHLPRHGGKSTWQCCINPLWALAHRWVNFVLILTDAGDLAEMHMDALKEEFNDNALLQIDYPELCWGRRKPGGQSAGDTKKSHYAHNGQVILARGMDARNLGIKVRNRRPDLIILDDIEPPGSQYGSKARQGRLDDIINVIFPIDIRAKICISGTTVKIDSIMHELVKAAKGQKHESWVEEQNIIPHHYPPIVTLPDGSEVSCWEEKFSIKLLQAIRKTQDFALNYANDPKKSNDPYWWDELFVRDVFPLDTRCMVLDFAVTSNEQSDFTALLVGGFNYAKQKVGVELALALKQDPNTLRNTVAELFEDNPDIRDIIIETTQGGDTWLAILRPAIPSRMKLHDCVKGQACPAGSGIHERKPSDSKPLRARAAADFYIYQWVSHFRMLAALEAQMRRFPDVDNDDLVDALGYLCQFYLMDKPKPDFIAA